MGCAIQYIERKGNGGVYGGYIVNDGTHTVFVDTGTSTNTRPLFTWLGKGDYLQGKSVYEAAFIMPSVLLSASQYNSLIASNECSKAIGFKGD